MLPAYSEQLLRFMASLFIVGLVSVLTSQQVLGMGGLIAILLVLQARPTWELDPALPSVGWAVLLLAIRVITGFIKRRD